MPPLSASPHHCRLICELALGGKAAQGGVECEGMEGGKEGATTDLEMATYNTVHLPVAFSKAGPALSRNIKFTHLTLLLSSLLQLWVHIHVCVSFISPVWVWAWWQTFLHHYIRKKKKQCSLRARCQRPDIPHFSPGSDSPKMRWSGDTHTHTHTAVLLYTTVDVPLVLFKSALRPIIFPNNRLGALNYTMMAGELSPQRDDRKQ